MDRKEVKIWVYNCKGEKVSRIKAYSPNASNLDSYIDGCLCDGEPGRHLGITKLRSGDESYALVQTYDAEEGRGDARTISDDEALKIIVDRGKQHLLNDRMFKRLKELRKRKK